MQMPTHRQRPLAVTEASSSEIFTNPLMFSKLKRLSVRSSGKPSPCRWITPSASSFPSFSALLPNPSAQTSRFEPPMDDDKKGHEVLGHPRCRPVEPPRTRSSACAKFQDGDLEQFAGRLEGSGRMGRETPSLSRGVAGRSVEGLHCRLTT